MRFCPIQFGEAAEIEYRRVKILQPLIGMKKSDVITLGRKLGAPIELAV